MNKYIKYKKPLITIKLNDLIVDAYDSNNGPTRNRMFLKGVYLTYKAENSSNSTLIPVFESIKNQSYKDAMKFTNTKGIIIDLDNYFESIIDNKGIDVNE